MKDLQLSILIVMVMCGLILFQPQPVDSISVTYTSPVTIIECIHEEEIKEDDEKMAIDKKQLRDLISTVLTDLGLYSEAAVELLMMTAATESHLGTYIKQKGGPAEGIFQMEPRTEEDIWDNYLKYKEDLANKVLTFTTTSQKNDLTGNLTYQIVMARIHYRRVKEALPAADDIEGLARYWKSYFNTHLGKGTVEKAVESYNHYVVQG